MSASIEDLRRLDVRAGTVVRCEPTPKARNPASKLWIDLGSEIGTLSSSARITDLYAPAELVGRQVLGVVNLALRQVGPFRSEVLTLGVYEAEDVGVRVRPDRPVPDRSRLG